MRTISIIVLTILLAPSPPAAGAAGRDISLVELSVEANVPADQAPSTDGRSNVVLTVRNDDAGLRPAPPAIALRAVYWAEDGEDAETWIGPLAGIDAENDDGTIDFISASGIAHTADTIPMTKRSFERGLLLVNEGMQISRPIKITRAINRELIVRYVLIPRTTNTDLFLPVEQPGEFRTIFGPMTAEAWEQRQGQGGVGLLYSSNDAEPRSLEVIEERFDVRLIYSDEPPSDNTD